MPFVLNPSGFCCQFSAQGAGNLTPGTPCPHCGRIVGHSTDCPSFRPLENQGKSSRGKLFNATAVMWGLYPVTNFVTFTLPSISAGRYQRDPDCPETGDIVVAQKFSKVLEAWGVSVKRGGGRLSYAWVSERQQERGQKYGGDGEMHFHVLVNQLIKNDRRKVVDPDRLHSLQYLWCNHLGVKLAANCVDVRPVPQRIDSIPAYVAKYLGKGKQKPIYSRRFACTRDLSAYQPIHLNDLPTDIDLKTTSKYSTPDGFEVTGYYFHTRQVLEVYGHHMAQQAKLNDRPGKDLNFTPDAILARAIKRQQAQTMPHIHPVT